METVTLGFNSLGQLCIDQFGNEGRLTDTKTFFATDELMGLLRLGSTDSSEIRIAYSRLKAYYYNNSGIKTEAKKPDLHIVAKTPDLDEAVGQS